MGVSGGVAGGVVGAWRGVVMRGGVRRVGVVGGSTDGGHGTVSVGDLAPPGGPLRSPALRLTQPASSYASCFIIIIITFCITLFSVSSYFSFSSFVSSIYVSSYVFIIIVIITCFCITVIFLLFFLYYSVFHLIFFLFLFFCFFH